MNTETTLGVPVEIARSHVMRKLLIIGHGYDDSEGNLTQEGRGQMHAAGEKLRQLFDSGKETSLILSSIAPRAVQSAEIIAGILHAPIEKYEVLWSEPKHPANHEAAYRLIQSARNRADLIVVVTHTEYATILPGRLAERDLSMFYGLRADNFRGVLLDYANKTITPFVEL
jgi:phosphohistidine phosphatase SixA